MPPLNARVLALTLCSTVTLLVGCQSGPRQAESFVAEYRQGDYQQAYDEAVSKYNNAGGLERDRAALMAGLSAHALNRDDEAQRWLNPLLTNQDQEVAGTAGWTLGVMSAERGDQANAARLASEAAGKLEGDDAARASMVAGDALARQRRSAEARAQYQRGLSVANSPATKTLIQSRIQSLGAGTTPAVASTDAPAPKAAWRPGTFIISLGAFSTRASADKLVASAQSATARSGQPAPRVVATTDRKSGRELFGVQIGDYPSRAAAQTALRQMGLQGTVMAAAR